MIKVKEGGRARAPSASCSMISRFFSTLAGKQEVVPEIDRHECVRACMRERMESVRLECVLQKTENQRNEQQRDRQLCRRRKAKLNAGELLILEARKSFRNTSIQFQDGFFPLLKGQTKWYFVVSCFELFLELVNA